jgi:hypothetical protein
MNWRIADHPGASAEAREVIDATERTFVISGSWCDGPAHEGRISYWLYAGTNGTWVLESEVRNPEVNERLLDAFDAGDITEEEFAEQCYMYPDEARHNLACREIVAIAVRVPPDADPDAVVADLFDNAIASGSVRPTDDLSIGPFPSLDPSGRTKRRLRRPRRRSRTTDQTTEPEHAPAILHQPFWCEENIWHLAQHPAPGDGERLVLVISGAGGEVACWEQRAGRAGRPILWDYHVVLAAQRDDGCRIWDLDSRLGYPLPALTWLHGTFPCPDLVLPAFQPRVAIIPAATWITTFGSDRAHMRRPDGTWQRPPPSWPPIRAGDLSVAAAIQQARAGIDLAALRTRLGIEG